MKFLNLIAEYLYIRKKDSRAAAGNMVRYMHNINRLSLLLFLLAVLFMLARFTLSRL